MMARTLRECGRGSVYTVPRTGGIVIYGIGGKGTGNLDSKVFVISSIFFFCFIVYVDNLFNMCTLLYSFS